jgi:hypothetical protein
MREHRADDKQNVRSGTEGFSLRAELEDDSETISVEIKSNAAGLYESRPKVHTPQIAYFSSWRWPKLVGPVTITAGKPGKRPAKTEENRLWRIKNFFVNLRARRAFMDAPRGAEIPPQEKEALERLARAWQQFHPGAAARFDALVASEKIEDGFDLFLVNNSDQSPLPVDALSSGEIEVLTFIGSFLVDDLSQGIILIDEPELHLHPAWHRVILRAIHSLLPQAQVICSTHSADILDSAPSYQRFVLLDDSDPRVRLVASSPNREAT